MLSHASRATGLSCHPIRAIKQASTLAGINDPAGRIEDGVTKFMPQGAEHKFFAGIFARR